ncbi:hypothetical protein NPIL_449261 [Nephila pilipes]|uniref:Uncharacterized protein n=1 Tax=Nephila pilipes TaxID=299642 RepID=A0A8X6N2X6_NEPPI|nr:hypothetical protein NPIL_449261 [Nephila pilipes]
METLPLTTRAAQIPEKGEPVILLHLALIRNREHPCMCRWHRRKTPAADDVLSGRFGSRSCSYTYFGCPLDLITGVVDKRFDLFVIIVREQRILVAFQMPIWSQDH